MVSSHFDSKVFLNLTGNSGNFRMAARQKERLLMWVDAVGGFLVCMKDQVTIGQAIPGTDVDIPINGDLARHHAVLRRSGEAYLLEPVGTRRDDHTWLDGRLVTEPATIADGDEVQFGSSVTLRFRQPHPLSASCRLEFLSSHRTAPSADAVLIMSDSCVLGPRLSSHVVCRHWKDDLVLARSGRKLTCISKRPIVVDGVAVQKRVEITRNSRISGSDFSVSLEELK